MFEQYLDKFGNPNTPIGRVKLANVLPVNATDDEIDFMSMLGVQYVFTWLDSNLFNRRDEVRRLQDRLDKRGIRLTHVCDGDLAKNYNIILGTERRDEYIEKFIRMLEAEKDLGLGIVVITWEADKYQRSHNCYVRGGALSSMVNEKAMANQPLTHGRVYEKEELWETFAYFMRQVLPNAKRNGVRIALHPNDPPMPMINGIASLITSYEDYKHAFEIGDGISKDTLGMEFCCGCWLEGGEHFGDIPNAFKEFAADGRIMVTHFRNISSPLPYFEERFIDDGYADMYKLMEAIYQADYDGVLTLDHTPRMCNMQKTSQFQNTTEPGYGNYEPGRREAIAFAIGYIKALMTVASRNVLQ